MVEKSGNNYRITFSDGPMGNRRKSIDAYAKDSDEAFNKAYQMPEAKNRIYTDVMVEEIPKEASVIGIRFEYTDTALKRNFSGFVFIKANTEAEAVEYYNKHFKGGRFWFDAGKTEADGKCIRGKVLETYFASCIGYHADATKGECLDEKLEKAKERQNEVCKKEQQRDKEMCL